MTAIIMRGDAAHLQLPDESVDLVVTSPPYFGLRSYMDGGEHYVEQVGAEATPTEYLDALIACTAEWMRVLKPTGSIFVNLGDKFASYEGNRGAGGAVSGRVDGGRNTTGKGAGLTGGGFVRNKSLMLLPERYRIRAVDELGLIARAVIVWAKPNGLPESVTDRVRRSHEDWVHLTKQPRYYAAVDRIREPLLDTSQHAARRRQRGDARLAAAGAGQTSTANPLGKLPGSVWTVATQPLKVPEQLGINHHAAFPMEWPRRLIAGWCPSSWCTGCEQPRRPAVDQVALDLSRPQARRAHALAVAGGLTEAHLAALLSVGVSDTGRGKATQSGTGKNSAAVYALAADARAVLGEYSREYLLRRPTSFREACACADTAAPVTPAVVLDPFGGTGTTALVADVMGRLGISNDLSADYCRLARWRVEDPKQRARAGEVRKPARAKPRQAKQNPEPADDTLTLFDTNNPAA